MSKTSTPRSHPPDLIITKLSFKDNYKVQLKDNGGQQQCSLQTGQYKIKQDCDKVSFRSFVGHVQKLCPHSTLIQPSLPPKELLEDHPILKFAPLILWCQASDTKSNVFPSHAFPPIVCLWFDIWNYLTEIYRASFRFTFGSKGGLLRLVRSLNASTICYLLSSWFGISTRWSSWWSRAVGWSSNCCFDLYANVCKCFENFLKIFETVQITKTSFTTIIIILVASGRRDVLVVPN